MAYVTIHRARIALNVPDTTVAPLAAPIWNPAASDATCVPWSEAHVSPSFRLALYEKWRSSEILDVPVSMS